MRSLTDMWAVRCRYVLDHGTDIFIGNGAYGLRYGPVHKAVMQNVHQILCGLLEWGGEWNTRR